MLGIPSAHLGLRMGVLVLNIGAMLLPLLHHQVVVQLLLLLVHHSPHLVEHVLLLYVLELLLEHELMGELLVDACGHHRGATLANAWCILVAM